MPARYRSSGIAVVILAVMAVAFLAAVGWDYYWVSRHPEPPALSDQPADLVLVEKGARRLTLFRDDKVLATYEVALGSRPEGRKQREGDQRTPEGHYVIDARNAASAFHLSLRISYPDAADRQRAAAEGIRPGGDIMIHGLRNGMGWIGGLHRLLDWTDGCVAVTDREIEDIWSRVDLGTPVEIRP